MVLLSSIAATVVLIWFQLLTQLWLSTLAIVVLVVSDILISTLLVDLVLSLLWPVVIIIIISLASKTVDTELILVLGLDDLEVPPLGENLHSLDILDGSEFLSVVLVAAKRVKIDFLSESLVLALDELQDVDDLLTVEYLVIIHSSNRVEDCPHDLWIVHSTEMIPDVQAEDDLV